MRLHDGKETFMTPSNSIARLEIGIPKKKNNIQTLKKPSNCVPFITPCRWGGRNANMNKSKGNCLPASVELS